MVWSIELISAVIFITIICYVFGAFLLSYKNFSSSFTTNENICASILTGTIALILLTAWISYLGGTVNFAGNIILGLFAIFLIKGLLKKSFQFQDYINMVMLLSSMLAMLCLAILPIMLFNSFNPYHDAFTYISIADYIRTHSFAKPVLVTYIEPMLTQVAGYQSNDYRMGAIFFLSLATQLMNVQRSIEIYTGVAAFGGILNLLAIYFFASRILKFNKLALAAICLLTIMLFSPIYFSIHTGFFPQLFGTAFLCFAVACLEQQLKQEKSTQRYIWMMLSMFAAAGLISAYSELAPVYLLIFIVILLKHYIIEQHSLRQFIKVCMFNGILWLVFANIEILRMFHSIFLQINSVAGWNVNFSFIQFVATAFGIQSGLNSLDVFSLNGIIYLILLITFVIFFTLGLIKAIRTKNGVWLIPIMIYSLMFIYFTQVNNPFMPGQKWHTWSLFKICNWAYPFVIIGVGYGFTTLKNFQKGLAFVFTPLIIIYFILIHHQQAIINSAPAISLTHSNRPFESYVQLNELVKDINIVYQSQPIELDVVDPKHRQMILYYLYPQKVYADFDDDGYIGLTAKNTKYDMSLLKNNLVLSTYDHINQSFTPLPAGVMIGNQSFTIRYKGGWHGEEKDANQNVWQWNSGQGEIIIHSHKPSPQRFLLTYQMEAVVVPMTITLYLGKQEIKSFEIKEQGLVDVSIPIQISKGKNIIKIVSNKEGVRLGQDTRLLAFRIQNIKWQG